MMKTVELTESEKLEKERYLNEMDEKARALGYENYAEQRKAIAIETKKRSAQQKAASTKVREELYSRQTQEQEERAISLGFKSYEDQYRQQLLKKVEKKSEVFSTEKIVVPPPMVKRVEALEFTSNQIPGEIVTDASGKLLKRYFEYEGTIGSLIDQYNNFITYSLSNQIFSKSLKLPTGTLTFENLQLNRPVLKSLEDRMVPLYPQQARNSGYSYTADIYVDMVLNKNAANEERLDKTFIGKIPVMLGSELDWMTKMSEEERVKHGESINETFGYFIIKGAEKIVMIQEKLRANRIFVFNSSSKGDIVCKVTNNTLSGSTQITMAKGKKSGSLKVHLGFLGRLGSTNKLGRTVSIFQIFRLLGIKDAKVMLDFVYLFTKPEYKKKIFVALQPSIAKLSKIGDDIEYISKKKGLGDLPYEIRKTEIMKDLMNQLFPQVEADQEGGITVKLYMLSMMIGRLVEYLVGARELDDRDNWGNKQLVTAGKSLELLFSSIWKEAILNAQTEIDEKKLSGLKAAQRVINPSFVTDNFIESFTANNWGVQTSYLTKENITDILKRDSILSVYSHLTKINTPTSTKVKSARIRMVQMSQLGYVDAAETPEGDLCLAVSTPILLPDGTWKSIGDFQTGDSVSTVNPATFERSPSQITNPFKFHTANSTKKMYRLTTINGRTIEGTGDHPFLTENGWVRLDQLSLEKDKVCLRPSQIAMSTEVDDVVILDEAMLRQRMEEAGIKESLIVKHTEELRQRGFLPLTSKYKYLHILARIAGFAVADGSLSISGGRSSLAMCFGRPIDAEDYLQDLDRLGFERVAVCYVENTMVDRNTGRESIHHVWTVSKSGCFSSLFIGLGSMYGKKTQNTRKPVPLFVITGSNLVKREYLAGFQGGDGNAMVALKREDKVKAYNFSFTEVKQHSCEEHAMSLFRFMMQMATMLTSLGIEVTAVSRRKDEIEGNIICFYRMSRGETNLINYMNNIGYRYASTKNRKSMKITEYLRYKNLLIQTRQQLKDTAIQMYKTGSTIKQISVQLGLRYRLAGSIIEYWREAGDNTTSLADPKDLIEYKDFCEQNPNKEEQYIFLKVAKIEEIGHAEVADFTTVSENHSFIADSFVTHNCLSVGTPVLMENNKWKNIEEIVEGDVVITVNPVTMERSPSQITKPFTFYSLDRDKTMYRLVTTDRSIEGTGDHPFLTQHGWIHMDKLNPILDTVGVFKNEKFVWQKIKSISIISAAQVCDFTTLSDNHSFIADGFIVHNCGLTKNTAMTAYMSLDRPEEVVEELVERYISQAPTVETINPFILNGVFKGWVNGKELKDFCIALKRGLKLPKDTAIVLERDGVFNIYTDACRPTRPLLVVDANGNLVIAKKNLWDADFETLLREGCVEYVDAWEQENIMLAQNLQDIDFRKRDLEMAMRQVNEAEEKLAKREDKNAEANLSQAQAALKELTDMTPYTHSEMDPSAILSIAVGVIPLPETNPGPRLTYQSGMGKQALGIYHSNHAARFDTTSKVLAYPSRPMFETQMNSVIGLDELPAGDTVILAITTYTGFAQEDALIMSQGAIDRGLFRSIIYKTYKSVRKNKTKNYHEDFARPEIKKGEEDRYTSIEENGLPRLGSFVKEGDCLIGKIRKNFTTGKTENASSFVEVKQEGVVDRVLVSTNAEGEQVVKVKIRQVRKPVIGDKYASRYAQKGTIGMILPDEDMPFTADGVRPDIIINPHSQPSRMTIGKMIEIVSSKVAAFTGERVNATAFRRFDVKEFMRNLKQYGYSGTGSERMYSGYTGKPLEAMIFTGPCYYQALRHQVADKIQMRARGGVSQLTHQPVAGRKRGGGLRIGEMERDAIISHGASAFLRERLCLVSDAYETVYCSTCGTMAIANIQEDTYICRGCDEAASFGKCTIPYSYKLLTQLLMGAGISTKFNMQEVKK